MNIEYDHYLIAYLDILGFKKICAASDNTGDTLLLNKIYDVCTKAINKLKEIDGKKEIKSIIISDSIILGMKQSNGNGRFSAKELSEFFLAVGLIQYELFQYDILLRGGISIGKAYYDLEKKIVVGPAFIDAYELESKQAIFPRVIVSTKLVSEFNADSMSDFILKINSECKENKQRALFNWDSPGDSSLQRLTKDVPFFIDFLRSFPGDIIKVQDRCNAYVERLCRLTKENNSYYSKYRWLEDYWLTTYAQAHGNYLGKTVRLLTAFSE